ncbi:Ran-specific GTPase-activating protein [Echinococcus granulosus]|uniref:Ran-specific GTPase-activating protein n=1 Tax=Echinococcus granulosus TaxID=6210 RepID=U6JL98_ECHGR|nr:Ran-specific GTPase-activating protein [Echinococcus granulosus]EUB61451.1 Ran-specific GTPase-activating protein [Echinococcus granulosus]CDS23250.1 Ran specific GTPase activating protein [Echinococcus granulosus]
MVKLLKYPHQPFLCYAMSHSGDEFWEENASAHFEPIVSRHLVDVKTLEEDEMYLFKARAKLFRFDAKSDEPEWKERGTGELKVLSNPDTHCCRVIMRRDKTLKICANHCILPCMELRATAGSTRGFVWMAPSDFTDNEIKAEILGVRFANAEIAQEFKKAFDKCKLSPHGFSNLPAKFSEKSALEPSKETGKVPGSTTPESTSKAAANQLTDRLAKLEIQSQVEKQSVDVAAH